MSAIIIQFPDRKSEVERIKVLEDWVEMQFWMYEQHLNDELEYRKASADFDSVDGCADDKS